MEPERKRCYQLWKCFKVRIMSEENKNTNEKIKDTVIHEERKRKHHYIFQAYMKAWVDRSLQKQKAKDSDDGYVWICRAGKGPYKSLTNAVAYENDYNEIPRLTAEEIKILDAFWKHTYPENIVKLLWKHLLAYQIFYIDREVINTLRELFTKINLSTTERSEIDKKIKEQERNVTISNSNTMEDFLSGIEGELAGYIRRLCKLDAGFYYKPVQTEYGDSKHVFLDDVSIQYFRTKSQRDRFNKTMEEPVMLLADKMGLDESHISVDHLNHMVFWAFQISVSSALYNLNAHLTILKRVSGNVPFITSDQPVINMMADYLHEGLQPTELVFYYPLSPDIAITINDDNAEDIVNIGEEKVDELNRKMVEASSDFIIGNSCESVNRYR